MLPNMGEFSFGKPYAIRGIDYCSFGGGGQGSGKVEYPQYLQNVHMDWLANIAPGGTDPVDKVEVSIVDVMNAALGASPFTGFSAYNPDIALADALSQIELYTNLDPLTEYSTALTPLKTATTFVDTYLMNTDSTSKLNDLINAYSSQLDADLVSKTYPRFDRGMQDINAVMSSAFVVGRALLEAEKERNVARFAAELYLQNYNRRADIILQAADFQLRVFAAKESFLRMASQIAIEYARIKIVAKKEQQDQNAHFEEQDALWDLEVFNHGGRLIAAIAGAAAAKIPTHNKTMSSIGGAMSGVAMGAAMTAGNPIGAGVGGILGFVGGLLGS